MVKFPFREKILSHGNKSSFLLDEGGISPNFSDPKIKEYNNIEYYFYETSPFIFTWFYSLTKQAVLACKKNWYLHVTKTRSIKINDNVHICTEND